MSDYVIAPVKPTHHQIVKAARAILNRAPTPDEYRDLYTAYQEMLAGQPDYGLCIVQKKPAPEPAPELTPVPAAKARWFDGNAAAE